MPSLFDLAEGQTCTVAGKYEASQRIGQGRFAHVFRAFDRRNARDVALKAYFPSDEASQRRCASEEKVLKEVATLNSPFFPKLIQSLKVLVDNKYHPLLVLELGEYADPALPQKSVVSLKDVFAAVKSGQRNRGHAAFWLPSNLKEFCLDLCQAVSDLHSLAIIHRDLKPANILLKRVPGSSRIFPFVLDFNAVETSSEGAAGTRNYLPPEVTHGSRTTPDATDDLWAVSRLMWEIYFGEGTGPADGVAPKSILAEPPPGPAIEVLRRALSTTPEKRYPDAGVLREHLEAAFAATSVGPARNAPREPVPVSQASRDRFHEARSSEDRIRTSVIYTLETGDSPPVPKEIRELVALAMDTCVDGSSTAIDLKADLVGIGPRAFPAILEQCYKLQIDGKEWGLCQEALEVLATGNRVLAERSLEYFCASSAYAVRAMCREMCARLSFLPTQLLNLYATDDGLLDPDERLLVLDVLFSDAANDQVFFWLVSHMCQSLIKEPTRYRDLRDSIAVRLLDLPGQQHAESLNAFALERRWAQMPIYRTVNDRDSAEVDRNVLRLLAEGFAVLPDACEILISWHRATYGNRQSQLWARSVWIEFMKKTLSADAAAEARIQELASQSGDTHLIRELERIRDMAPLPDEAIPDILRKYLTGRDQTKGTFNKLRFDRTNSVMKLLRDQMRGGLAAEELERAVCLLEGFESRARPSVVRCVLENWTTLKAFDLDRACGVLTQAHIRPSDVLDDAVMILDRELRSGGGNGVRNTLHVLLSWQ